MKVLFDWDDPDLEPLYALKRGVKLIVYAFCKFLGLRPKYVEEVYLETEEYAKAISKLNRMLGVETVFGIKDNVAEAKPSSLRYLRASGNDVRRHIHIGKYGSDRRRLWEPPLTQSMDTWHFDQDYHKGVKVELKRGELPIWHVDRPYWFISYVNFLDENWDEIR
jgi:hypothetical protein